MYAVLKFWANEEILLNTELRWGPYLVNYFQVLSVFLCLLYDLTPMRLNILKVGYRYLS